MHGYEEIYRQAFADALADNLQGIRPEDLTPEQCEQARSSAQEFAEGEVEAAKALAAEGRLFNAHETTGCPLGSRCESCGAERADLAVRALPISLGVICLTLCPPCMAPNIAPPITFSTATRLVDQHRAHLEGNR